MKNDTPLHCAATNHSLEIGEILLSKGADVNAKNISLTLLLFIII